MYEYIKKQSNTTNAKLKFFFQANIERIEKISSYLADEISKDTFKN